jgi:hypothetical protein
LVKNEDMTKNVNRKAINQPMKPLNRQATTNEKGIFKERKSGQVWQASNNSGTIVGWRFAYVGAV